MDTGVLATLKFVQFWFEPTPQGKFVLNISFGQSKYYVDALSENTKRGLRQKVRRGEYPSFAPVGYINDSRTKSVIVDKKSAPIIRQAFELYAEGNHRLKDVSDFLAQHNILSRSGKRIHITRASFIMQNPFYTGLFRYAGEIHEGKYEPIIAKKLFDKVQEVMKQRGRPRHKAKPEPQVFCGLLRCGSCGMMITGEYRVKKQKNGNEHYYTYYHCTKKRKNFKCPEPCIRQEELDKQLFSLLQKISLRTDWAEKLQTRLDKDKTQSALEKTARDSNLFNTKVAAEQVFGSNLVLAGGQAGFKASESDAVAPQNQWAILRAAHKLVGQKTENQILERDTGAYEELPGIAFGLRRGIWHIDRT
ncbi:MAG: recombinase family protein [Patescibacteria group bacterium]